MTAPAGVRAQSHDPLRFEALLDDEERAVLDDFRAVLARIPDEVLDRAWERAEFPFELMAPLAESGQLGRQLVDDPVPSYLLRGLLSAELARKDASLATFVGVSGSLFGLSVRRFGSEAQRAELLPAVARGDLVGAFALTEPDASSDISSRMTTTARRDGDEWVLRGTKRWIGNATWCHRAVVWAREVDGDGRLLGFVVPTDAPGWRSEKIDGKYSLRTVQNAHITLTDVRVPDSTRLPGASSFRDISAVLTFTRLEVGWVALGNAIGAFDAALRHAVERERFGRPLAGFQLVQDLLVRAQVNITSSLGTLSRAAALADRGELADEHASLVKLTAAAQARDTVARCRELLGGDGVLLEHGVMKRFVDAEAVYTFEGTHQINTLLVGRALTGVSAFA